MLIARKIVLGMVLIALVTGASAGAVPQEKPVESTKSNSLLWRDPGDIRARDLFYGPGGESRQPQPPFQFEKEDLKGNSPKFDVTDATGKKWRVKLGTEARPEAVASRLLWAVGYFANYNYVIADLHVQGMPGTLSRGNEFLARPGEAMRGQLQRKPGKDHQPWSWRKNPFRDTREFNGLRVMMALIHDWDLKDDNNAWYEDADTGNRIYYVSDVGSTFGTTGKSYSDAGSKSNLKGYSKGEFISKVTPEHVSFNFPTMPAIYHIFNLPYFIRHLRNRWIGREIPLQDVRWIASLLSQLTPRQIRDAFRAAGYAPDEIEGFATVLETRIAALAKL